MVRQHWTSWGFAAVSGLLALGYSGFAHADGDQDRRGFQIEGMIGGAGCLPGPVPCRQNATLDGQTLPSFGVGAAAGFRLRWLLIGGLYRWGMFNPSYGATQAGSSYEWGGQHTAAFLLRPILPIWRIDLGLNIAPGFGRQVFYLNNGDVDYSQGFSFLTGPTLDIFITERFFMGAEVDFIINTQKKACAQRDDQTTCSSVEADEIDTLAPTHQVVFGLHVGGVAF